MNRSTFIALLTGCLPLALAACAAQPTPLEFVDHVEAGLIEQDVYVERAPGSGEVYRINPDEFEAYRNVPIYGTKAVVVHSPFNPEHNGPYKRGRALGMTLADWLAGTGTALYSCDGGTARIDASFQDLVPNGIYTMWYAFAGQAHMGCPDCPFSTIDFPVGTADGSQSAFKADSFGTASFALDFEPCLQLTDERLATMLAIVYHSDKNTYGPAPGPFGKSSHIQLFTMLPRTLATLAAP